MEDESDGIFPVMRLSYVQLPNIALKQCFLSCSLFPKKHVFRKNELIRIWMALGFLGGGDGNKRMEDIGEDYFNQLLSRFFFKKVQNDSYEMHEAFHGLAKLISSEEYFTVEANKGDDHRHEPIEIPEQARHVYLDINDLVRAYPSLIKMTHLRSLVIAGCLSSRPAELAFLHKLEEALTKLRRLRVLILSDLIPGEFDEMRHLRYLQIQSNNNTGDVRFLPDSLCKMYHLQTLAAKFGCKTLLLPRDMNRLIRLRWIDTEPETMSSIAGIGNLTSLQGMGEFRVKKKGGFGVEQLQKMNEIKGWLCISSLENVTSKQEARKAELHKKAHLRRLELRWGKDGGALNNLHESVLQELQPHRHLRALKITGYMGREYPTWLVSLASLKRLSFINCGNLSSLPTELECMPSLETLLIDNCPRIDSLPKNGFPPQLKELQINTSNLLLKRRLSDSAYCPTIISQIPNLVLDGEYLRNNAQPVDKLTPRKRAESPDLTVTKKSKQRIV